MFNWLSKKGSKERRKEYTDSRLFDATCRNHGGCPWCEGNRTHFWKKKKVAAETELKNFLKGM